MKDLGTGSEMALVTTPADKLNPKITLDGSRVVYTITESQNAIAYVVSAMGGIPRKVCDHCYAMPWCADGRRMLFIFGGFLKLLDVDTGRETEVAKVTALSAPRPSWDDHWIAFYNNIDSTHTRIFIASLREGLVTEEPQWTAVSDGSTYDIVPDWSPDGGLMYFLSDRDGFRCLWAQRLEPVAKKPVGPAFAVQHFHSAHLSPKYVKPGERGISVARDKIVVTVAEHLGNIWMEDLGAK